jgi:Holliday junction DNA helicase RuvA
MIHYLRGALVEALPTQVVIDVHGVGYQVLIPLSSFEKLPPLGSELQLLTVLVVREDAHTLYGFATAEERDLFRLLIDTVAGVGPKLALNVLSGMRPLAFRSAVSSGDVRALAQISGVGRKTAERMVVELKDKLGTAAPHPATGSPRADLPAADQALRDAALALAALGFKQNEAFDAARATQAALGPQATVEEIVRASLKKSSG